MSVLRERLSSRSLPTHEWINDWMKEGGGKKKYCLICRCLLSAMYTLPCKLWWRWRRRNWVYEYVAFYRHSSSSYSEWATPLWRFLFRKDKRAEESCKRPRRRKRTNVKLGEKRKKLFLWKERKILKWSQLGGEENWKIKQKDFFSFFFFFFFFFFLTEK